MQEYSVLVECPTIIVADTIENANAIAEAVCQASENWDDDYMCCELDRGSEGPTHVEELPDGTVQATYDLYLRLCEDFNDEQEAVETALEIAEDIAANTERLLVDIPCALPLRLSIQVDPTTVDPEGRDDEEDATSTLISVVYADHSQGQ